MIATVLVVCGVCGAGKSTLGAALASHLSVPFKDGDDLHPSVNIDKMSAGVPLDDSDRFSWLDSCGRWLSNAVQCGVGGVLACSALKRRYRDVLRAAAPTVFFLFLSATDAGARTLLAERLAARAGTHFMPASLLESQLAACESPGDDEEATVVVDVRLSVEAAIAVFLNL